MLGFFELYTLTWGGAVSRVFLACLFGFFLGFDRSRKNKPVDFRVYMIVAASACLVAIMAQELAAHYNQMDQDIVEFDIMRVIQGVLVGIGFLGAGAIIHKDDDQGVIGTATGASIWSAGSIGLLLGFGFYALAGLGFIVLVIILVGFGYLRQPLFGEKENYDRDDTSNMSKDEN